MNDPLVLSRLRVEASPVLQRIAAIESPEALVDELFLAFLSRYPSASEKRDSVKSIFTAASRERAVEDLAWAIVNKTDFVISY